MHLRYPQLPRYLGLRQADVELQVDDRLLSPVQAGHGTLINVFILAAIVLLMLGLSVSVLELLFIIPVVFLISYGVPGIPGELVLFAGPMATLLNIPEPILPVFLAVYLGLQIGLPDSFRTGNNSTDDYIGTVMMNAVYEKRYAGDDEHMEEDQPSHASKHGGTGDGVREDVRHAA